MAEIITELPKFNPVSIITIRDVVALLPATLPWPINVGLAGKLAWYGKTVGTVIFLTDAQGEPTVEQRQYFEKLIEPLGVPATLSGEWNNSKHNLSRLYNDGRLIVRMENDRIVYTELPTPVNESPILTIDEAIKKLPRTIPFKNKLFLTGGLTLNGWTANDFDFIAEKVKDKRELAMMARYFTGVLGWKTDVGADVMPEREPVKLYPIYEHGRCLLP